MQKESTSHQDLVSPPALRVVRGHEVDVEPGFLTETELAQTREAYKDVADPQTPWINTFVKLVATGTSYAEAAELLGKPLASLQLVAQTPRFQSLLIQSAKMADNDVAKSFLSGQVMSSLVTLATIRDDPKVKPETRLSSAKTILEFALGKPVAKDKMPSNNAPDGLKGSSDDPAEVAKQLDAKIKRLTPKTLLS